MHKYMIFITKEIVVRVANYLKISLLCMCLAFSGCQSAIRIWHVVRVCLKTLICNVCRVILETDSHKDDYKSSKVIEVSATEYQEVFDKLEKLFENNILIPRVELIGKRSLSQYTTNGDFQILWYYRNQFGNKSCQPDIVMVWIGRGESIFCVQFYFYLGRPCQVLDDVVYQCEQKLVLCLDLEQDFSLGKIGWLCEFGNYGDKDDIAKETLCFLKSPFHSFSLSEYTDFMEMFLHALKMNDFERPVKIGGRLGYVEET